MTAKAKKIYIAISLLFFLCFLFVLLIFIVPNTRDKTSTLYIPMSGTYEQVIDSLDASHILRTNLTFKIAARCLLYKHILPGKYIIPANESNLNLILKLRKGQHYPVKLTFNNIRTKQQFIEKIGYKFLFDPLELEKLLENEHFLNDYGLTPENVISVFIPDSYEFYFDISAEEFFEKMHGYYERFWNAERREKAQEIGLAPMEIATLASIVEEENFSGDEKAIIAGLYINRLKRGMKLQADPTVKFALNDFSIKRIYQRHLEIDSPYNTYRYEGLPPGPIRIPETATIDSVLNYTHHKYIFMCAKEDFSGRHNFAETDIEHARNAQKYHRALNKRGI